MKTFGLLGFPLGHSFSQQFFAEKFNKEGIEDCQYINFSFPEIKEAVEVLKKEQHLSGFNITIPHKINIFPYLDAVAPDCEEIQSCNCVKVENGKWKGFNTDIIGFENSLKPLLGEQSRKALVFGTGGASRAIIYVLKKMGIEILKVSRNSQEGALSYEALTDRILKEHTIWINTTPVGLYPQVNEVLPVNCASVTDRHLVYDLIYNPPKTKFLMMAELKGASIKNGREMLEIQAEESWKIWNS